jgi:signal transduction histidine kinase
MPPKAPSPASAEARPASKSRRRVSRAALEEQKRSFLRVASHELRTPLNSILGFSEILACELYGPLGSPQYKEYAEIIRGSGKKLLKLVNQVMEMARLEDGSLELSVGAEAVEAAIEESIAGLSDELAARGLSTRVIGAEAVPLALCDPWGLRTVLGNLLHNAVVFSPEGGEIRVRVRADTRKVVIAIEDDGEGVEPGELPRLLQPFEQGENALIRRTEGAGLGLPICERTCLGMGGRLKLSSAPGKGLVAQVQLKRA